MKHHQPTLKKRQIFCRNTGIVLFMLLSYSRVYTYRNYTNNFINSWLHTNSICVLSSCALISHGTSDIQLTKIGRLLAVIEVGCRVNLLFAICYDLCITDRRPDTAVTELVGRASKSGCHLEVQILTWYYTAQLW